MDASRMTRRQLLQRFGAVGGSSLVMGAMGAWDLMGPPSGPRPVLKGTRPDTKVIVLGAGLSGLTVGYEHSTGLYPQELRSASLPRELHTNDRPSRAVRTHVARLASPITGRHLLASVEPPIAAVTDARHTPCEHTSRTKLSQVTSHPPRTTVVRTARAGLLGSPGALRAQAGTDRRPQR